MMIADFLFSIFCLYRTVTIQQVTSSSDTTSQFTEHYIYLIAGIFFIFFTLCGLIALCHSQRRLKMRVTEVTKAGAKEMRNGLIVCIPIGQYENTKGAEIPGFFPNLPVERDAKNMKELANFLNYDFLTID